MPHPRPTAAQETGTVSGVHDHGTVVLVMLDSDRGGVVPVHFDRRAFGRLLAGEGCGAVGLIGRRAEYDGRKLRLLDAMA